MSKVHFISVGVAIETWSRIDIVSALCGDKIENAAPVFKVDLERGILNCPNTILFCRICWLLAHAPVQGVKYIYGVLPAEEALKLNSQQGDE